MLFQDDGYEFLAYDMRRAGWRQVFEDDALSARKLPDGLDVKLTLEGRPVVLSRPKDAKDKTPQVMIFSNGDLNSFAVTLERDGGRAQRHPDAGREGPGDRARHGGGEAMNLTRRAPHGFTLIEVLVALAIVAIGMAAVMSALSSSAHTLAYLRDRTFAQWVALNQIANLRLSGQQPPVGDSNGDTDFAGRSWHWSQKVVSTEVPGVARIDVSVRPADAKGDDEHGWFTTVSGIWGDAVGVPNGLPARLGPAGPWHAHFRQPARP